VGSVVLRLKGDVRDDERTRNPTTSRTDGMKKLLTERD
jgi:hypothetical protein